MILPKYRPKGKCPKCRYDSVSTGYQQSGHSLKTGPQIVVFNGGGYD